MNIAIAIGIFYFSAFLLLAITTSYQCVKSYDTMHEGIEKFLSVAICVVIVILLVFGTPLLLCQAFKVLPSAAISLIFSVMGNKVVDSVRIYVLQNRKKQRYVALNFLVSICSVWLANLFVIVFEELVGVSKKEGPTSTLKIILESGLSPLFIFVSFIALYLTSMFLEKAVVPLIRLTTDLMHRIIK